MMMMMDGTTAMETATGTEMANGWHNGDSNGRHDGNAAAMMTMDGTTTMQQQ